MFPVIQGNLWNQMGDPGEGVELMMATIGVEIVVTGRYDYFVAAHYRLVVE